MEYLDTLSMQEYLKKNASEAFSPSLSLIHTWRTFCSSACNEFIKELMEVLYFLTGTMEGLESLLSGCAFNNTEQAWNIIKNNLHVSLVVKLISYATCSQKRAQNKNIIILKLDNTGFYLLRVKVDRPVFSHYFNII